MCLRIIVLKKILSINEVSIRSLPGMARMAYVINYIIYDFLMSMYFNIIKKYVPP